MTKVNDTFLKYFHILQFNSVIMKRTLFCLVIVIFLGSCKHSYSHYKDPKKAKHSYTGKKRKDHWMDLKREDIHPNSMF